MFAIGRHGGLGGPPLANGSYGALFGWSRQMYQCG
jgi:hypothetical protein